MAHVLWTRLLDFTFVFACEPTCDMSQLEDSLLDVEPCARELTCGRSEKSFSMILNWAWFAKSTWHGTRLEQLQFLKVFDCFCCFRASYDGRHFRVEQFEDARNPKGPALMFAG